MFRRCKPCSPAPAALLEGERNLTWMASSRARPPSAARLAMGRGISRGWQAAEPAPRRPPAWRWGEESHVDGKQPSPPPVGRPPGDVVGELLSHIRHRTPAELESYPVRPAAG